MNRIAMLAAATLLVLLRHGDAGDMFASAERDALRPLTAKGRKHAHRAGKALVHLGLVPHDVWTSSLVRAVETADGAVAALDGAVRRVPTAALAPDAAPERVVRALRETPVPRRGPTGDAKAGGRRASRPAAGPPVVRWLVGHEPHLSRLLGHLTGAPSAAVVLPKGAFAVLETDGKGPAAGGARVVLLVAPDALKALRHGPARSAPAAPIKHRANGRPAIRPAGGARCA